jgi:hypothetical protein
VNRPGATGSLQLTELSRDLYRIGAAGRRNLRTDMERAGQSALSDARSRAGRWSRRIPASLSLRTQLTDTRVVVQLRSSARVAPHARSYEGLGHDTGSFRHPVYGRRDRWVQQSTRPSVWPAVAGRRREIEESVAAAYERAIRESGFR